MKIFSKILIENKMKLIKNYQRANKKNYCNIKIRDFIYLKNKRLIKQDYIWSFPYKIVNYQTIISKSIKE